MTQSAKELPIDLVKVLNEWALAAGRYLTSAQTGYIHYYYGETEQEENHTIPLLENTLFALALLRSRLVESIQESKVLLKQLLVFQNLRDEGSKGNFPTYLHEYPVCRNPSLGLQLLAPFYWILKHFGHILGADLRMQLEQSANHVLEYSLRFHQITPYPYSFAVRLAAAQLAFGILWGNRNWQEEGIQQLEKLASRQLEGSHTTNHLAGLLAGLQMIYPSLLNSPWRPLWLRMEQTWHHQTGCYIGPCLREWQDKGEPQCNLYDLYAGYFAGQFSRRATLLQANHLHAALIQPSSDKFVVFSHPLVVGGQVKHQSWQITRLPQEAYTLLEKKEAVNPSLENTYTLFRFIWGDLHFVHSLVCQGGHYERVEFAVDDQSIHLFFHLNEQGRPEDKHREREIEFFTDFHPDVQFTLSGHTATTFELGQTLSISLGKHQLSLTFSLLEGEANFLGHLMRGNRPSQIDNKGVKRFQSYDWTIFLRTIRRKGPCRVQATIKFLSQSQPVSF